MNPELGAGIFFILMIIFYIFQLRAVVIGSRGILYPKSNRNIQSAFTLYDQVFGEKRKNHSHYPFFAMTIIVPFIISLIPFLLSSLIWDPGLVQELSEEIKQNTNDRNDEYYTLIVQIYMFVTLFSGAYLSVLITVEFSYLYDSHKIDNYLQRLLLIALALDVVTFIAIVAVGIGVNRPSSFAAEVPSTFTVIFLALTFAWAQPWQVMSTATVWMI